ncbi:fibronectin type III domain-containing protein [Sphaerisporangium rhizosphaerae]|uniref:Fibronectin type III domain-containing protein n=1 Tax=Sphaerisporangium rhizosphaerae TaxID=2269375 RepID=A0ABW2P180_9ACTN
MPDSVPPTAPAGLKAGRPTAHAVTLTWSPARDNVAVKGYQLPRQAPGEPVRTQDLTATRAVVTDLAPGRRYTFWVRARDLAGNLGPKSQSVQVTTPPR